MLRASLYLVLAGFLPNDAPPPVMFRGNPEHTGVSDARFFPGQGGVKWRVTTGGAVRSSPAVTATRVFVGSGDGHLYAIERGTGRVAWRYRAGGPVDGSPAVAEGLVVCATIDGHIFAVEERTGRLRWERKTGAPLPYNTTPAGGWDLWASSPAIVGPAVLIGGPDGVVYSLDLKTGRENWRAPTGGRVRATPAVSGNLVVVGSWNGRVYGLDLRTGRERWVHRTMGDTLDSQKFGFDRRAIQSSAAIADGGVYLGSRDGAVYGLEAATGERRWRVSHRGSWVIGSPAVRGGRVYAGSSDGHFVHALDAATGREVWKLPTRGNVLASPVLLGSALVIATSRTDAPAGELLTLDAVSGAVRWRLPLDEASVSTPAAADGELYLGTEAGSVLAIHEVSPVAPRMAVFHDSALAGAPATPGGRLATEYFRELGYEVLGSDSLTAFLRARAEDEAPSAVVFAMDVIPVNLGPQGSDAGLLRRYLDRGGKIVNFSVPLGVAVRDSAGNVLGDEPARMEPLLGVAAGTIDYDENSATPTKLGRAWGIDRAFRGDYPIAPKAVSEPLAVDRSGKATAWLQVYRPDRPGSGYVQLWGFGATIDRLPVIRAVAEYGLLRRVGG
ncbi:MAG TPA: PQQ-binding-like beta-propeller repeat protein [Gemmatimonadales bacterium]